MKALFIFFFLLILKVSFGQVTNVRVGIWSDQTVWSNNTIPTDTTNITLNYDIVIDINATCKSLNTNGHNVTVNSGLTFNVSGTNFRVDSTFTDSRDDQVYKFKHICSQVGMMQYLN